MDQHIGKDRTQGDDAIGRQGMSSAFEPCTMHLSDADHGLIILCDHAENTLPPGYGTLGLVESQLARHIGYDIGAKALSEALAKGLDASLVMTRFSRLLIDPNRGLDDPTLIMCLSDGAVVPGNACLDGEERARRITQFYLPYDRAIKQACDHVRGQTGKMPVLFSVHSFTPIWRGFPRPWHAGVLWDKDPRFAVPLIEALKRHRDLIVGDNEPYRGELEGDTMHRHATLKGLPHALLEVRQDLIHDHDGVEAWAQRLLPVLAELLQADGLRAPIGD